MKVVVADEVRPAFRHWLRSFRDVQVVGEAATAALAEALLTVTDPDVLLVDIHQSGDDGMAVARRIRERFPQVRVLVLGEEGDGELVAEAVRIGASGCIVPNPTAEALLYLMRQAARGRRLDFVGLEAVAN